MRNFACYLIDHRKEYFLVWLMTMATMWFINISLVYDRFGTAIRVLATITLITSLWHVVHLGRYCKWDFFILNLFGMFCLILPFIGMIIFHQNGLTVYSAIGTSIFVGLVHLLFTFLFAFWVSQTRYNVQTKKAS